MAPPHKKRGPLEGGLNDTLGQLTNKLELLCDWRDRLQIEIRRAELLMDLGLLDQAHFDALTRRIGLWREAAKALGARADDYVAEFRAACAYLEEQYANERIEEAAAA